MHGLILSSIFSSSETPHIHSMLTFSWLSCSIIMFLRENESFRRELSKFPPWPSPSCIGVTLLLLVWTSSLKSCLRADLVLDLMPSCFLENIIDSLFILLHHQLLPFSFRSLLSGHKHGKYFGHLKNTILGPDAPLTYAYFLCSATLTTLPK